MRRPTSSEEFQEGYADGFDSPEFITGTQPETIKNPYPEGSQQAADYEAGYRAAIA